MIRPSYGPFISMPCLVNFPPAAMRPMRRHRLPHAYNKNGNKHYVERHLPEGLPPLGPHGRHPGPLGCPPQLMFLWASGSRLLLPVVSMPPPPVYSAESCQR